MPIELTREKYAALGKDGVQDLIYQTATAFYKRKEEHLGSEMMGSTSSALLC
ncbi:MAG: hypothetical protein RMI34_09760 [Chloroherpetonaceae bacterium]|nr:hypothetical protein [Chloroherpetonaceae bacterium]